MFGSGVGKDDRVTIRRLVLEAAHSAHKGHIGSALSVVDILLAAEAAFGDYFSDSRVSNFVLSKGHAASALYSLMVMRGVLSEEDLGFYCSDGSLLGTHPSSELAGVTFASGSLGQGLGVAVGLALADHKRGLTRPTLCLMSDAELNEGSSWEALLVASHQQLENLTLAIDVNGQQALGMTKDVLDTSGMAVAAEALGWNVRTVNGHDLDMMIEAFTEGDERRPRLVLCETVLGSGVSFMEGLVEWHYLPLSDAQYRQAIAEVEESAAR